MKQPWMKFYPADWRSEPSLRICSVAARGLWMEMLCIMHDADPRGSFVIGGSPVTIPYLAALVGNLSVKQTQVLFNELDAAKVFSRDDDGTIYSRRIRRDIEKAAKDKANGKGGGNPNLKPKDKPGVNPCDNGGDKTQRPETRDQIPERELNPNIESEAGVVRFRQGIMDAFQSAGSMSFPETGKADVWISLGYEPSICLAVIREGLARKRDVSSLIYFEPAIKRAHEERAPKIVKADLSAPTVSIGKVRWPEPAVRRTIDRWRQDGTWPNDIGPPPDHKDCEVPRHLLEGIAA